MGLDGMGWVDRKFMILSQDLMASIREALRCEDGG